MKKTLHREDFTCTVKKCGKVTGHKLSAEKEKDPFALKINPYSVAWKLKTKDKLIPVVVGHIPREISRFVSFLMDYVGRMEGVVLSPEFKASPIPRGGLEIILRTRFTIAEEKSKYLHHLKELIKDYYEPVTELRGSNNGENRLNDIEQHSEEKQNFPRFKIFGRSKFSDNTRFRTFLFSCPNFFAFNVYHKMIKINYLLV